VKNPEPYLTQLQTLNLIPNFWMSQEYFDKAGIDESVWTAPNGIDYVIPTQLGYLMFPPLNQEGIGYNLLTIMAVPKNIWASLPDNEVPPDWYTGGDYLTEFLDFNFIYDPKGFLGMEGKTWQTFRKNVRKWPRNNPMSGYWDINPNCKWTEEALRRLLIDWLQLMGEDTEIHDDEVLFKYVFEGLNRKGLFNRMGELVGLNIWDENYKFINYRFCICRNEPFLSEYMRYLFYRDPLIQAKGKLVNDGGALDRPELERFKRKLNPIRVYDIFSWKWVRS